MTDTQPAPNPHVARPTDVGLWQTMVFRDADLMIDWLRAVGLVEHATHRGGDGLVQHAEWLWPHGGGVMFSALRPDGFLREPGKAATYLVSPDPAAFFVAAVAAGGTVQREMAVNDYGGHGGSVLDPEGNSWSVGSYVPGVR